MTGSPARPAGRLAACVVGVAAMTLPEPVRERHRQEWLADLAGAEGVGVSPSGVAVGALVFSATLNRDAPEVSGMPIGEVARRRARWGIVAIAAGGVFGVGSYVVGGFASAIRPTLAPVELALSLIDTAIHALAITLLLIGVAQLWRAARLASPLATVTAALATVGLACLVAAAFEPALLAPFALTGLVAVVGAAILGFVVMASAPLAGRLPPQPTAPLPNRRAVLCILAATVGLLALVAVGAVDLLVWGPLAQTDGLTLDEVYAGLGAVDRANGIAMIVGWIVIWTLFVVSFAAFASLLQWRGRAVRSRGLFAVALLGGSALLFFQPWAGFSLGMGIADTLPPYAGGISPVGYLLMLVGQASFVGALVLGVAPRRPPRDAVLAASLA